MAVDTVGRCVGCATSPVPVVLISGQQSYWCKDCLFSRAVAGGLDPSPDIIMCEGCGDRLDAGSFCSACSECSDCGSTAMYCDEHGSRVSECTFCSDTAEYCADHSNRWCTDCGDEAVHVQCDGCRTNDFTCNECGEARSEVCRTCFDDTERLVQFPDVVMSDDGVMSVGETEVRWS